MCIWYYILWRVEKVLSGYVLLTWARSCQRLNASDQKTSKASPLLVKLRGMAGLSLVQVRMLTIYTRVSACDQLTSVCKN